MLKFLFSASYISINFNIRIVLPYKYYGSQLKTHGVGSGSQFYGFKSLYMFSFMTESTEKQEELILLEAAWKMDVMKFKDCLKCGGFLNPLFAWIYSVMLGLLNKVQYIVNQRSLDILQVFTQLNFRSDGDLVSIISYLLLLKSDQLRCEYRLIERPLRRGVVCEKSKRLSDLTLIPFTSEIYYRSQVLKATRTGRHFLSKIPVVELCYKKGKKGLDFTRVVTCTRVPLYYYIIIKPPQIPTE
ncbi:hypothetical protein KUTeg_023805 [Tegillarca granosa]|uniref:Uncharacterized protein n=1 Tax=Tegillarca granosa TaxID=220873 RepID=A0ABQ9E8A8_TEGGR|nr:hypothetical protein KUTeg_023805 [Tegillarca granosa]